MLSFIISLFFSVINELDTTNILISKSSENIAVLFYQHYILRSVIHSPSQRSEKVALKDFNVYFFAVGKVFNLTLSTGRSSEMELTSREAFASESGLQGGHAAALLQNKH